MGVHYSAEDVRLLLCGSRRKRECGLKRARHADDLAELADLDERMRDLHARGLLADVELSALLSRFRAGQMVADVAAELEVS